MLRTLTAAFVFTAAPALAHDQAHFHLHEITGWEIAGAAAFAVAVSAILKVLRQ